MSAIPAYRAIRDHLEGEICKRQPNDRLPTQSELSSQFGVSHLTVRRALRELEDAGLIFRMRGKGTFVRRQTSRSCSSFRIGVVLPAYMQVSEIWGDLLRGFVREMPNRPLTLLIHPLDADLRSLERTVVREGFHGVIAPFPYAAETAAIRHLFRIGHPVIVVNRIVKDAGIHYVSTDHFGGARELARHLVSRGHRRFAVVGVQEVPFLRERVDGLRAGIAYGPDDTVHVEIAVDSRRRADGHGFVSQGDVEGSPVRLGIDSDGGYAHFAAGPDDPHGDFAAVGD